MIVRMGEFRKKGGELRQMRFVRIADMTEEQRIYVGVSQDDSKKQRVLAEGSETVYDVDAKGFRVFNWATVTGEVEQQEMEIEL